MAKEGLKVNTCDVNQLMGQFALLVLSDDGQYIYKGEIGQPYHAFGDELTGSFCLEFHFLADSMSLHSLLKVQGLSGVSKVCLNGAAICKCLGFEDKYDCDERIIIGRNILKIYVDNCANTIVFNQPVFLLLNKE